MRTQAINTLRAHMGELGIMGDACDAAFCAQRRALRHEAPSGNLAVVEPDRRVSQPPSMPPRLGFSVALVERDRLGGNSLNTGSVPSTAIIRPVRLYGAMRNADEYGRARAI